MNGPTKIDPKLIRLDRGTQIRSEIDEALVDEYAEAMAAGVSFPPPVVFYDGTDYVAGDGFHRTLAAIKAGFPEIRAEVKMGDAREATLYAVGANANHGKRRSQEDKRRAVLTMLNDPEWRNLSDRQIAQRCKVSHPFVGSLRNRAYLETLLDTTTRTAVRNGTAYEMKLATVATEEPEPDSCLETLPLALDTAPLTDEEWLDSIPIRNRLSDASRKVMDDDALLWRELHESPEAVAYLKEADRLANNRKVVGLRGHYQGRVSAYLRIKHPRSWLTCGSCCGTGCDECNRRGFVLS